MRNQRPDVSAQDGCASCKVLLKKLLRLLSQGAPSLISDLLAGVTTCRSAPPTLRTGGENSGKFVTYPGYQTNRRLIFITLNFRPTNGRRCLRILIFPHRFSVVHDGELYGRQAAGKG